MGDKAWKYVDSRKMAPNGSSGFLPVSKQVSSPDLIKKKVTYICIQTGTSTILLKKFFTFIFFLTLLENAFTNL